MANNWKFQPRVVDGRPVVKFSDESEADFLDRARVPTPASRLVMPIERSAYPRRVVRNGHHGH